PVTATVSVTGACGTATANASITVNAAAAPTVAPIAGGPFTVFSTAASSFAVSATDPNVPAQAVTFAVAQAPAGALLNLTVTPVSATSATVSFTAPALAVGSPNLVVTLSITATNSGGTASAPATAT